MRGFSGSYPPDDVTFLLEPIEMTRLGVEEKERLIQAGRHYSELIGREERPSAAYQAAFDVAFAENRRRFARDLLRLALLIDKARRATGELTLVSLARAGTPIGVLLKRILERDKPGTHYSISIVRDRGIDEEALRYILERHPPESVVFVDGWTAKGVIQRELERSLRGRALPPELFVVADLSGTAAEAATGDDYLIPSAILNATISGLISRSILSSAHHRPGMFHGTLFLEELAPADRSRWFIEEVMRDVVREAPSPPCTAWREARQAECRAFVARARIEHSVRDENLLKPGVAEATRVLLRRVPQVLLVRAPTDADIRHLLLLASERGVPTEVVPDLPYKAAAIIRRVS